MKVAPFLAQILLAASATAIPLAAKQQHARAQSAVTSPVANDTRVIGTARYSATEKKYDGYGWSGASHENMPFGSKFTGVGARFKIPEISVPAENEKDYEAGLLITVGIDGRTHGDLMLSAGIHSQITVDGRSDFYAYYEWLPGHYSPEIYEFNVQPGDEVQISIETTSPISATIIYENVSTGQIVSRDVAPADPSTCALAGADALWIVHNYIDLVGEVPPARFNKVTFTDTWAELEGGQRVGASGATLINTLPNHGRLVTTPKVVSDKKVEIVYNGPK